MKIFDPKLTGSIEIQNTITGNVTIAGGLTVEGSLGGGITGSATASYVEYSNIANKPTLLSGSSQIASDISGSFISLSSSLASELLKNTTDTLTGDLTVTGTLTAQEFHTEYVSGSIIYESGSTKFGDDTDDRHDFTGSISIQSAGASGLVLETDTSNSANSGRLFLMNNSTGNAIMTESGILNFRTGASPASTSGTKRLSVESSGTVTIGDGSTSGTLQFENDIKTRKVVLYLGANNDNEFYGFGVENSTLVYSVYTASDDHVFFSGYSGGRTELMRIGGDGKVGIGTNSPNSWSSLDINGHMSSRGNISMYSGQGIKFNQYYNSATVTDKAISTGYVSDMIFNSSTGILSFRGSSSSITAGADTSMSYNLNINSSGNVGIGTTSPDRKLEVRSDTSGDVVLAKFSNRDGSGSEGAYIGFSTGYGAEATIGAKREGAENDSSLIFSPMLNEVATERMRITSSGKVGIGSATPEEKLTIDGTSSGAYIRISNAASGDISSGIMIYNGSNLDTQIYTNPTFGNTTFLTREALAIRAGGNQRMSILSDGNVGIGTNSPSAHFHVLTSGQIKLHADGTYGYISIGSSGLSGQYPYLRTDSFRSDGSGYFWAFGHETPGGVKSIKMLINDNSTDEVTIINSLAVRRFASNEFNASYPTFSTGALIRSNDTSYFNGGSVGIGTTSPSTKLDVRGGSGGGSFDHATFTSVTNRGLKISTANSTEGQNGAAVIYNAQDGENYGSHEFQIGGSTKMFIKGNNVGIGTTSPSSKLHSVITTAGDSALKLQDDTGSVFDFQCGISGVTGDALLIKDTTLSYDYLTLRGGSVGIGTTSPTAPLTVQGSTIAVGTGYNFEILANNDGNWGFQVQRTDGVDDYNTRMKFYPTAGSTRKLGFWNANAGEWMGYFDGSTTSDNRFIINGGDVGIGTTNPKTKLQVNEGAIGMSNTTGNPLNARLVKQGSTSVLFTIKVGAIGAWRAGHAFVKVSGAQNGLQEHHSAWYHIKLVHYYLSGVANSGTSNPTCIVDSGGNTGNYTVGVTATNNADPQEISINISSSTTNSMIADIDCSFTEGIQDLY